MVMGEWHSLVSSSSSSSSRQQAAAPTNLSDTAGLPAILQQLGCRAGETVAAAAAAKSSNTQQAHLAGSAQPIAANPRMPTGVSSCCPLEKTMHALVGAEACCVTVLHVQ
jgi:hypothetical protein